PATQRQMTGVSGSWGHNDRRLPCRHASVTMMTLAYNVRTVRRRNKGAEVAPGWDAREALSRRTRAGYYIHESGDGDGARHPVPERRVSRLQYRRRPRDHAAIHPAPGARVGGRADRPRRHRLQRLLPRSLSLYPVDRGSAG